MLATFAGALPIESLANIPWQDWIPAGRFGTSEEIAGSVLYLLGRAGGYLNGAVITPDGGVMGQLPCTW